jgi:hypothetical protein
LKEAAAVDGKNRRVLKMKRKESGGEEAAFSSCEDKGGSDSELSETSQIEVESDNNAEVNDENLEDGES